MQNLRGLILFNFLRRFFNRERPTYVFRVLARRYQVPPSSQPVFRELYVRAENAYDAARRFDQTYTGWVRLSVTLRPEY